ncbi:unnamed protein product [Pieris macdunnoughi]|uniref:Endonuclease-reverse transcriptase n=1 Tax=Pieris macdunnoughi TaxID=345717 RepID=A0A821MD20_9NEOP|nr:unnamed protein product [Pieris macdunnoughi]
MERSILKLRRINKIKNVEIRKKTKITDALEQALRLKWKWAGHIARARDKRWTLEITKWTGSTGKRCIGRQRKRWTDDIVELAGGKLDECCSKQREMEKYGGGFYPKRGHTKTRHKKLKINLT